MQSANGDATPLTGSMSMESKRYILTCEYFKHEFAAVLESEGIDDLAIIDFPAYCDRPILIHKEVSKIICDCIEKSMEVHIFGGYCLAAVQKQLTEDSNCTFHIMDQCHNHFADCRIINDYIRDGAHLMTPGSVMFWKSKIEEWGFDKDTARDFFRESVTRLVLLDTEVGKGSLEHLRDFADFVDRPYEVLPVGLDQLRSSLNKINQDV